MVSMEDKLVLAGQTPADQEPSQPAPNGEERYRTLKNGAVYDMVRKRICASPGGGTTAITQANAAAYSERRRELKRQALLAGAQAATADIRQRPPSHELEWIEVIAEANMHRAADPGNVKGVDAGRWLVQEAGLAEQRQQVQPADVGMVALLGLIELARPMLGAVDAEVTEADE
jgi:hypothetical protein